MTHKRSENTSRVWRRVPDDVWVTDLDGNKSRKTSWCNVCRCHKPIGEFYSRNDEKCTFEHKVEGACIPCYDERVKKQEHRELRRKQREQRKVDRSLNTVFSFIMESDNERS